MNWRFAATLSIALLSALASPARAYEILIQELSNDASLSVSAYDLDGDRALKVSRMDVNQFKVSGSDKEFFAGHAYRTISINFTWTPAEGSEILANVRPMSIEIEVLLRAWESTRITLNVDYFSGIGEQNVLRYERIEDWPAGTQFARLVGATLLSQHFDLLIGDPKYRHARRSTSAALSAARLLSDNRSWFLPPKILKRFVEESIGEDRQHVDLLTVMAGRRLSDLLEVENIYASRKLSCTQWVDFFAEISDTATNLPDAVKNFFPDGNFVKIFREKRAIASSLSDCS